MKVLAWGDRSNVTGFGSVMKGILENLPKSWDIKQVGISYNPHDEIGNIPDNIDVIDARSDGDAFGRKRLIKILRHCEFDYDLVFLLQDSFLLSSQVTLQDGKYPLIQAIKTIAEQRGAKVVTYTPMDQPRPYIDWFDRCLEFSDKLVYYLDWARKNAHYYSDKNHKEEAKVIHHGVERDKFFELDQIQKHELKKQFGLDNDKFNILFGGANQRRKNIPHDVMSAFIRLYQDVGDDVKLLMKTEANKSGSTGEGWNLAKINRQLTEDFDLPQEAMQFIGQKGGYLTKKKLNEIYNAVDAVYVPSCEGWGLWATEAMCTRTPTLTGNHASLSEIGDKGRSIQVKTEDDLESRVWFTEDLSVYRSQINLDSFVGCVKKLMDMKQAQINKMLDTAEESVYTKAWPDVANKWEGLFKEVVEG